MFISILSYANAQPKPESHTVVAKNDKVTKTTGKKKDSTTKGAGRSKGGVSSTVEKNNVPAGSTEDPSASAASGNGSAPSYITDRPQSATSDRADSSSGGGAKKPVLIAAVPRPPAAAYTSIPPTSKGNQACPTVPPRPSQQPQYLPGSNLGPTHFPRPGPPLKPPNHAVFLQAPPQHQNHGGGPVAFLIPAGFAPRPPPSYSGNPAAIPIAPGINYPAGPYPQPYGSVAGKPKLDPRPPPGSTLQPSASRPNSAGNPTAEKSKPVPTVNTAKASPTSVIARGSEGIGAGILGQWPGGSSKLLSPDPTTSAPSKMQQPSKLQQKEPKTLPQPVAKKLERKEEEETRKSAEAPAKTAKDKITSGLEAFLAKAAAAQVSFNKRERSAKQMNTLDVEPHLGTISKDLSVNRGSKPVKFAEVESKQATPLRANAAEAKKEKEEKQPVASESRKSRKDNAETTTITKKYSCSHCGTGFDESGKLSLHRGRLHKPIETRALVEGSFNVIGSSLPVWKENGDKSDNKPQEESGDKSDNKPQEEKALSGKKDAVLVTTEVEQPGGSSEPSTPSVTRTTRSTMKRALPETDQENQPKKVAVEAENDDLKKDVKKLTRLSSKAKANDRGETDAIAEKSADAPSTETPARRQSKRKLSVALHSPDDKTHTTPVKTPSRRTRSSDILRNQAEKVEELASGNSSMEEEDARDVPTSSPQVTRAKVQPGGGKKLQKIEELKSEGESILDDASKKIPRSSPRLRKVLTPTNRSSPPASTRITRSRSTLEDVSSPTEITESVRRLRSGTRVTSLASPTPKKRKASRTRPSLAEAVETETEGKNLEENEEDGNIILELSDYADSSVQSQSGSPERKKTRLGNSAEGSTESPTDLEAIPLTGATTEDDSKAKANHASASAALVSKTAFPFATFATNAAMTMARWMARGAEVARNIHRPFASAASGAWDALRRRIRPSASQGGVGTAGGVEKREVKPAKNPNSFDRADLKNKSE
ncbi:hypothetical protein HDU96_007906 [Phlyctochytrium bullatum]|nr:hypothetical protein HDU96_007906 [Phlyctochytrium bullatum]